MRHGRTPNNAQARLQGQSDSPLDEVGFEQSAVVGKALWDRWPVDRLVVSSRRRTQQTARAAGLADVPTTVDDRWTEIDFGAYDDRRIGDVMAELGAAWASDVSYVPPGGESMTSLHERVGEAVAELAGEATTSNILVVTHATPIKSAVVWLLGGDAEMIMRLRVSLASITAFRPVAHGLVLSEFNWCPARHIS
ncbi:MAG: histidine phosphatase family protein [Acidimicrobiaceae bacterium]|nr:histidine phosphatase family protein [Acidimicrobiaceae bacterium]MYE65322.1 histidine phosphatase family protein [Acidimicrobiaceae bacterium]